MKTIGLIGGMSWESSSEYYRLINEAIKAKVGGLHSAKCILYSLDFAEIAILQRQNRWSDAAKILIDAAKSLENGGADFLIICANTMHKVADDIQANVHIPLLHIADVTAKQVREAGICKVGLLGTRYTMEEDFYIKRLKQKFSLDVLIPNAEDRQLVNQVIFDELVVGKIYSTSKKQFIRIIERLVNEGAEGIILGCTEIGLLIQDEDCRVPIFDTTKIHALAAVEYALTRNPPKPLPKLP
jgi:aspartate racemase